MWDTSEMELAGELFHTFITAHSFSGDEAPSVIFLFAALSDEFFFVLVEVSAALTYFSL